MEEIKTIKDIDFIPIEQLKGKHFIVKDYQRGYKWEKEQILALLNDIKNHKQGKYCLQPIVVQETLEGIELIDGQQRMTTTYLILEYLGLTKYFTIDYQTRPSTQEFLQTNMDYLANSIRTELDWNNFIKEQKFKRFDNVDVYHIYGVYKEIYQWFKEKNGNEKKDFQNKLLTQTYVIWYDIKVNANHQKAEDVFLNLNAGKILLTNSELIKALFILSVQSGKSKEITQLKSAELASEWDTIENKLHEDSFWYFICDHDYYNNIDTRIDFIIDIANEIAPKKDWDGMDSYRNYEKTFINKNPLDWPKIKQTFNKLNEWFDDKEIYHYVGYLVVTDIKSLKDIVKEGKGKNKESFKKSLIEYIKKEFEKTKKEESKIISYYKLDNLDYQEYRIACQNVLLLLNVQYFLNNWSQNKFPYELYKKECWSVEHINPQNPKEFNSIESIIKWLDSFYNYFRKNDIEKELGQNILEVINLLKLVENQDKKLAEIRWPKENIEKLQNVIDLITDKLELHGISNLALLDRNTNSHLSNKIFMEKRRAILDLYYTGKKNEVFIPECTRDVFTKNFTEKAQNVSDEIFGLEDMDDYKEHIQNQLKNYYPIETNGN